MLDKSTTIPELEAVLASAGHLIDVLKIGWGISYVDRTVKERVALCGAAGITVCLGGTLLESVPRRARSTSCDGGPSTWA